MKKDLLEEIKTEMPDLATLIDSLKKIETNSENDVITELEQKKILTFKIESDDKKNSEGK